MEISPTASPTVEAFFHEPTNTITYVLVDKVTKRAAVIDSVLDYEPNTGSVTYESADAVIRFLRTNECTLEWILETHVHADHLSAAQYIKDSLGGKIAIGSHITDVQETFGKVFGDGPEFQRDGSQFDYLFREGDEFDVGTLRGYVINTPGHTPADVAYVIGDAVFVGDTLFMPDYGTARVDFPGGSASVLHASVQKLFALPGQMRMYVGHDYLPPHRSEYRWETTVGEQKEMNVHLNEKVDETSFSQLRNERDAMLGMPRLIIPSLQVNMRAGMFPKDGDGKPYIKIPIQSVFSKES
jgi:glyoxylase-like metal-dependent hydrolase (beta-lactamase superfamily II)